MSSGGNLLSVKVDILFLSYGAILLPTADLDDFVFRQLETRQNWEAESQAEPRLVGFRTAASATGFHTTGVQIGDFQLVETGLLSCGLDLAYPGREWIHIWDVFKDRSGPESIWCRDDSRESLSRCHLQASNV